MTPHDGTLMVIVLSKGSMGALPPGEVERNWNMHTTAMPQNACFSILFTPMCSRGSAIKAIIRTADTGQRSFSLLGRPEYDSTIKCLQTDGESTGFRWEVLGLSGSKIHSLRLLADFMPLLSHRSHPAEASRTTADRRTRQ